MHGIHSYFVYQNIYFPTLYFIFKDALPQKKLEEFCEIKKKFVNRVKTMPIYASRDRAASTGLFHGQK